MTSEEIREAVRNEQVQIDGDIITFYDDRNRQRARVWGTGDYGVEFRYSDRPRGEYLAAYRAEVRCIRAALEAMPSEEWTLTVQRVETDNDT